MIKSIAKFLSLLLSVTFALQVEAGCRSHKVNHAWRPVRQAPVHRIPVQPESPVTPVTPEILPETDSEDAPTVNLNGKDQRKLGFLTKTPILSKKESALVGGIVGITTIVFAVLAMLRSSQNYEFADDNGWTANNISWPEGRPENRVDPSGVGAQGHSDAPVSSTESVDNEVAGGSSTNESDESDISPDQETVPVLPSEAILALQRARMVDWTNPTNQGQDFPPVPVPLRSRPYGAPARGTSYVGHSSPVWGARSNDASRASRSVQEGTILGSRLGVPPVGSMPAWRPQPNDGPAPRTSHVVSPMWRSRPNDVPGIPRPVHPFPAGRGVRPRTPFKPSVRSMPVSALLRTALRRMPK